MLRLAILPLFALAACQGNSTAENNADALDNAAAQSTPAAAAVLNGQAEAIRAGEGGGNLSDPQGPVQEAMNAAATADAPRANAGANPDVQAKPHEAGDPVPPPKVRGGGSQ